MSNNNVVDYFSCETGVCNVEFGVMVVAFMMIVCIVWFCVSFERKCVAGIIIIVGR